MAGWGRTLPAARVAPDTPSTSDGCGADLKALTADALREARDAAELARSVNEHMVRSLGPSAGTLKAAAQSPSSSDAVAGDAASGRRGAESDAEGDGVDPGATKRAVAQATRDAKEATEILRAIGEWLEALDEADIVEPEQPAARSRKSARLGVGRVLARLALVQSASSSSCVESSESTAASLAGEPAALGRWGSSFILSRAARDPSSEHGSPAAGLWAQRARSAVRPFALAMHKTKRVIPKRQRQLCMS